MPSTKEHPQPVPAHLQPMPKKKYLKILAIGIAATVVVILIIGVARPSLFRRMLTSTIPAQGGSMLAAGGTTTTSTGNFGFMWGVSGVGPSYNNEADGVAVDNNGNVYVSGIFSNTINIGNGLFTPTSRSSGDVFVMKFDKTGKLLWHHEYGGTGNDNTFDIDVDPSNNIVLNGWFAGTVDLGGVTLKSQGNQDQFLMKMSPAGYVLWAKAFGGTAGDGGNEVVVDKKGNIYASALSVGTFTAGSFTLQNHGQRDSYVMKVSPTGEVLWVRGTEGSGNERIRAISTDSEGNVYGGYEFSGEFKSSSTVYQGKGGFDGAVVKWDNNGNQLWSSSVASSGNDDVRGITGGPSGSFYVTGFHSAHANAFGTMLEGAEGVDSYVAKFNENNTVAWMMTLGSSADEAGGEIVSDDAGNMVYSTDVAPNTTIQLNGNTVQTLPGASKKKAILLRVDPSGAIRSINVPNVSTQSSGNTLAVSGNGTYVAQIINFWGSLTYGTQSFESTGRYKSFLISEFSLTGTGGSIAPPQGSPSNNPADVQQRKGILERLLGTLRNLLQSLRGGHDSVNTTDSSAGTSAPPPSSSGSSGSGSVSTGQSAAFTMNFAGAQRTYILHVPSGYDSSKRYSLMVSYHGEGGSGAGQEQKTGFNAVADENGFFVAYPSAVRGDWKLTGGSNDIEFSKAFISAIENAYSIDSSRIYVSGFSAGGSLAQAMACVATDTIAGMAYASNTLGPKKAEQCKPSLPIAIVGFSGTQDVGSEADTRDNYSYQQTAEYWATQNGCVMTPVVSHFPDTLTDGTKVTDTKQVWSGCKNGVTVTLYTIEGGEHVWPGGVPSRNETDIKVGSKIGRAHV